MSHGKLKLFVGAKVLLRNGLAFVIDTDRGDGVDFRFVGYQIDNKRCRRSWSRDGGYRIGGVSEYDIVNVLNPQDDPEVLASGVSSTGSRTAPDDLPDNLKECWERCAYGFKPSPEELRALWSLAGFPLPSPRRRCDECNCTGQVDGMVCTTCGSSGYLPVEDWDGCVPLGG